MTEELVNAIQDLTKVVLATSGKFESRNELARTLAEMGIPAGRIAQLTGMKSKHVSSAVKAKKGSDGGAGGKRGRANGK